MGRFAIGKYEVSMAEYKEFALALDLPGPLPWEGVDDFAAIRDLPVNLVNQYDASRYCGSNARSNASLCPALRGACES